MQFPSQREAFASNEVRELAKKDIKIDAYSLRIESDQIKRLIVERSLEKISCSHYNFISTLQFIPLIIKRFQPFIFMLKFVFSHHLFEIKELAKNLVLLPRYLQILDSIISGNYDVVHLYWSHYPSIIGLAYKKFYPNRGLTMSLAAYDLRKKYIGSQKLIPISDCVTTHSEFNVSKINEISNKYKSLKVIYRGVPEYVGGRSIIKDKYKISSVGALIKEKGFEDVLKAYKSIKKSNPRYYLNIYGTGPYESKLKELVDTLKLKDVIFKQHLPHKTLMDEIGSSSIFIFMSHVERLPNVVKEAIMNKCFCVTSRTEGIEELFIHKEASIVEIGDHNAASKKILDFINDPISYRQITEDNCEHIKLNFSLEKTTDKYIQLWKSISRQ
jgi:glycosyltransferase involved in cell wall biosynthesis